MSQAIAIGSPEHKQHLAGVESDKKAADAKAKLDKEAADKKAADEKKTETK